MIRRFAQATCLIALAGSFATLAVLPLHGGSATADDHLQPVQHVHSDASSTTPGVGTQGVSSSRAMPVAVDGATNPELVPDALAYRHFFLSTLPLDASPAESSMRQELRLTKVGLKGPDREAYLHAMGQAGQSLASIAIEKAAWLAYPLNSATARVTLKRLADEEAQVFVSTRQLLRNSLTAEGFGRLDSFVRDHVRRQIKIYGTAVK